MIDITDIKARLRELNLLEAARGLAEKYRVSLNDVLGYCKEKWACIARQHLWLLIHDSWDLSCVQLARIFSRDNSTVSQGIRKHRERIEREMGA